MIFFHAILPLFVLMATGYLLGRYRGTAAGPLSDVCLYILIPILIFASLVQNPMTGAEFARIFAWAVAKSDRLAEMGWYAAVLDLTLNTEMELHRSYAARFGITAEDLEQTPMWPTTRAYTDFLVRTAADGDMADLVAALLPCAWGYVFVARKMAESDPPEDQRYADWIAQYASAEFEKASEWLKAEMNRLAESAGAEKRKRLEELFVISSRYEWRFWQMCWESEAWEV